MAGQLGRALLRRVRSTIPSKALTTQSPTGPTKEPSGKAGQTGRFLTPLRRRPDQNRTDPAANTSSVDRG
jgi:hypothetical protein